MAEQNMKSVMVLFRHRLVNTCSYSSRYLWGILRFKTLTPKVHKPITFEAQSIDRQICPMLQCSNSPNLPKPFSSAFTLYVDLPTSTPLALATPFVDACAGKAIGCPLALDVNATNSFSIRSRTSRAKSSTSAGVKFVVSIGFSTKAC